ncbi:MAG: OB-fold nucleic acid binding domain-containing protein [Bacteroidales bacterium]|nr:OB-fold nucleic acid binding domain-containing protein [Bacteroidales bacterium]
MKKISTYIIILSALMAGLFSSCNRWEEPEFQAPVYDGPAANHTIADIKAMHPNLGSGAQDSICSYDDVFIVKATVVSSDQGGNCYKYLTIQDETGGIEISIDRSGLYNEYPVGQTVYLDCRGLIVGDYHNKYQVGWKYNGSVGRINQAALGQYLHKDGIPDMTNPIVANPIEVTGSSQLTPENVNCLVKINGCTFDSQHHGQPLASNDFTCDRTIYINGTPITVRTSNYAYFRNIIIDATKEYCLYGILSVYNSNYQLTLRTKEDVQEMLQDVVLAESYVNANSLTNGTWGCYPANNSWQYRSFQGADIIFHNSATEACDDWLISPVINLSNASSLDNVILEIKHQNNVSGSLATYYQVYYSTTYTDGEDPATHGDWQPFTPNLNVFPNSLGWSNALDLSVLPNKTFRIALRYHKDGAPNGTPWAFQGYRITQLN